MRHAAADRLIKAVGPDRARQAMGHEPQSKTLEKTYTSVISTIQFTEIALGQGIVDDRILQQGPAFFRLVVQVYNFLLISIDLILQSMSENWRLKL